MRSHALLLAAGLAVACAGASRPVAPWPPPAGPLRVIIDADAANEVDDQYAIALALGSPARIRLEGLVAAHFGLGGGAAGIDRSYAEIETILERAGMRGRFPVRRGADPLVYRDRPPASEGVDFIIAKARAATPADPLWLVLLGPATDAAAALLRAPDIADRLVVFWHGRTQWPVRAWNFNAYNDIKAVQILFSTPCRLVLFDTGTYLTLPPSEGERRFAGLGSLGAYLHEVRTRKPQYLSAAKGFFDLGDVAALVDERSVRWQRTAAPGVDHDLRYDFTRDYGEIVRIHHVERDAAFDLLEAALKTLAARPAAAPAVPQAVLTPRIDGPWWQVAGNPDLGKYNSDKQEPVDFAVWQAADGSWQLWSCIRRTACPGRTRLLYRWQGARLSDPDWQPMGIAMTADPGFGETEGGLQAPFVFKAAGAYHMFYGDWENICHAESADGKTFARRLTPAGRSGMFGDGPGNNTRDPMVIEAGGQYLMYYTAFPDKLGADYARASTDMRHWGPARKVAFGGSAGTGPFSAECPFVYHHQASGWYYLFRTQIYGQNAQTRVYRSRDPLDFGVESDRYLVATLPVAAPEIIEHAGQTYIVALLPSLKGIRIARLKWAPGR